jgi:hypothetical protein
MNAHFLICSERSGSNLIAKIFDSKSDFCGPSPIHLLRLFVPALNKYGNLNNDKNWETLLKDIIKVFELKIGRWNINITYDELYNLERDFSSIYSFIYSKEANFNKKPNLLIKEVRTYNLIPYILNNYTSSKFLLQIRDPRDMACSWKKSPVHRGDTVRAANIWHNNQKESLKVFYNLALNRKVIAYKYEDLLQKPESTLRKICEFLDTEFEESMLEFHSTKESITQSQKTDNWKNLNRPLMQDNFNKFRKELSDDEIKYIEFLNHKLMKVWGYELEFDLIDQLEFENIENRLKKVERQEKQEYNGLSEAEKAKREEFHKYMIRLDDLRLF